MRRKSGVLLIDEYPGVVIASDEAGYGSWCGPLVVAAASAPIGWDDPLVRDSKRLSPEEKRDVFNRYKTSPLFHVAVVVVSSAHLDRNGVYQCLVQAHVSALRRVYEDLGQQDHIMITDGSLPIAEQMGTLQNNQGVFSLPKADSLIPECSLASIFAKVTHDDYMVELDKKYPQYHLAENMGYGQNDDCPHRQALREHGPCPEHRITYDPVMQVVKDRQRSEQFSIDDFDDLS